MKVIGQVNCLSNWLDTIVGQLPGSFSLRGRWFTCVANECSERVGDESQVVAGGGLVVLTPGDLSHPSSPSSSNPYPPISRSSYAPPRYPSVGWGWPNVPCVCCRSSSNTTKTRHNRLVAFGGV